MGQDQTVLFSLLTFGKNCSEPCCHVLVLGGLLSGASAPWPGGSEASGLGGLVRWFLKMTFTI